MTHLELTWAKNKKFADGLITGPNPNIDVSLIETLTTEFGVKPESEAQKLLKKYSETILDSLQAAREYNTSISKKGQPLETLGGLARRAIEGKWKPKQTTIPPKRPTKKSKSKEEYKAVFLDHLKIEIEKRLSALSSTKLNCYKEEYSLYLLNTPEQKPWLERYQIKGLEDLMVMAGFRVFMSEKILTKEERKFELFYQKKVNQVSVQT